MLVLPDRVALVSPEEDFSFGLIEKPSRPGRRVWHEEPYDKCPSYRNRSAKEVSMGFSTRRELVQDLQGFPRVNHVGVTKPVIDKTRYHGEYLPHELDQCV
jgi:hypothetical protein